mmetsp:Transcript_71473/g.130896  ORF Transcript_71473/g.130896 Transcript_71473/m.130896 type:complete len:156 (+) Transcript_71473:235-702(+)
MSSYSAALLLEGKILCRSDRSFLMLGNLYMVLKALDFDLFVSLFENFIFKGMGSSHGGCGSSGRQGGSCTDFLTDTGGPDSSTDVVLAAVFLRLDLWRDSPELVLPTCVTPFPAEFGTPSATREFGKPSASSTNEFGKPFASSELDNVPGGSAAN